jgi:hypothetical protein
MRPVLKSRRSPAPRRLALEALEPRLALAGETANLILPIGRSDQLAGVGLLPGGEIRWGGQHWTGGKLWDFNDEGDLVREQTAAVPPGRTRTEVLAVSPNGRWVAAVQYDFDFTGENLTTYVVWDAELNSEPVAIDLSAATSFPSAQILDVSNDGVAIVQVGLKAYRWDAASGLVRLASLYELEGNASAEGQEATILAISADGRTIVGSSGYTLARRPTVWTEQGPRELPTLLGRPGGASSVSSDGRVIGGWVQVLGGEERYAAVWVDGELHVLSSEAGTIDPTETTTVVNGLEGDPRRWIAFGSNRQQAWIAFDGRIAVPLTSWLRLHDLDFAVNTDATPERVGLSNTSGVLDAFLRDGQLHIAAHEWMATMMTNSIPGSVFYAPTTPHWIVLPPTAGDPSVFANPLDVSGEGHISPIDALLVINALNEQAAGEFTFVPGDRVDTSRDGQLTPLDALLVINYLNSLIVPTEVVLQLVATPLGYEAEGEADATLSAASMIGAGDIGLHAADVHVGGDEERLAVIAKLAVGGALSGVQAAEGLALGGEAIDAAGTGGPDVPLLVDRHPIRQPRPPFLGPLRRVEQDAALAERAVGVDGEGFPDGGLGVGLGDVKRFLVRRKAEAVGARHLLRE